MLDCLSQICNVFGVGDNFTSTTNFYMDHGWPELQIDVLYECIRVAEAVPGWWCCATVYSMLRVVIKCLTVSN